MKYVIIQDSLHLLHTAYRGNLLIKLTSVEDVLQLSTCSNRKLLLTHFKILSKGYNNCNISVCFWFSKESYYRALYCQSLLGQVGRCIESNIVYFPLHSTRCCCILWTAGCCRPTVHMSGLWGSSQWPGAPAASSWPSAAMMRRYGHSWWMITLRNQTIAWHNITTIYFVKIMIQALSNNQKGIGFLLFCSISTDKRDFGSPLLEIAACDISLRLR